MKNQKKLPNHTHHYKYQICVSGAARGESVEESHELAERAGKAIAEANCMLLTGATVGIPNYAAEGCKKVGGLSLGISPAASKLAHIKKYRLPTEAYDIILYSGLNYVGRDSLLVASSDAVVSIGGRIGTLHEFTLALEMGKPIGFLIGTGGVSQEIDDILRVAKPLPDGTDVFFDDDPERLVRKLITHLNKTKKQYGSMYR